MKWMTGWCFGAHHIAFGEYMRCSYMASRLRFPNTAIVHTREIIA